MQKPLLRKKNEKKRRKKDETKIFEI